MSSAIQAVLKTAPRRATLKKVRALTARKAKPSKFTPSDAYVILGHGEEGFDTFIVPDNCIIIAKARPTEIIFGTNYLKYSNILLNVNSEESIIYKDPLSYIPQLINQFGSFVLYKPGDECPNFRYSLVDYMADDSRDDFLRADVLDGVIKLPLNSTNKPIDLKKEYFPSDTVLTEYLKKIYKYSTFPSIEKVIETIREYEIETNTTLTIESILDTDVVFDLLKLEIRQKDLLMIDENGHAHRPGVYYNFICRQDTDGPNAYETYSYVGNNKKRIFNYTTPQIVSNKIVNIKSHDNTLQSVLKRSIGEAETKRKQLLRGTKYNTPSARKTRRRRN